MNAAIYIVAFLGVASAVIAPLGLPACLEDYPRCYRMGDCCEATLRRYNKTYASPSEDFNCTTLGEMFEVNVYVIDRCPTTADDVKELLSEDQKLNFIYRYPRPVLADGIVYRNTHCANCNGITLKEIQPLPLYIACMWDISLNFGPWLFRDGTCRVMVNVTGLPLRKCYENVVSTCQLSNATDYQIRRCKIAATNYTSVFRFEGVYRNKHCFDCGIREYRKVYPVFRKGNNFPKMFSIDFGTEASENIDVGNGSTNGSLGVSAIDASMRWVTLISSAVSVVSLFVLVVWFILGKSHPTFAVYLTLILAVNLMVSMILVIVGNFVTHHYACKSVGVLLHLFFLSVFTWTLVIGIDMAIKFKSMKHVGTTRRKRRMTIYCTIVYTTTVSTVVFGAVMDRYYPSLAIAPNYGSRLCWLNAPLAKLVLFLCPVVIILIINILITIVIVISIRSARTNVRRHSHANGRGESISVVLKLVVILGLPWIASIVADYTASPAIRLGSNLLNGLQGAFLALAMLCTAKTYRRIRSSATSYFSRTTSSSAPMATNSTLLQRTS